MLRLGSVLDRSTTAVAYLLAVAATATILLAPDTDPSVRTTNQAARVGAGVTLPSGAPETQPVQSSPLPPYIARRWRIDGATAERYVDAAFSAARQVQLDPALVLAVIARESSFVHFGNPNDLTLEVDPMSVDPSLPHGPMQVSGRWHPEKMPVDRDGKLRPTTREENITAGARVLAEYVERNGGNLRKALRRYNGCSGPACKSYPAQVLKVRDELRRVMDEA
jgi:soluble lytic murein transglycosylase-like protein